MTTLDTTRPDASSAHRTCGWMIGGWLLVAAAVGLAWHRVMIEMWLRWFPAWDQPGGALFERLAPAEGYYAHGPFVPLVSFALAWWIVRDGRRRGKSRGEMRFIDSDGSSRLIGALVATMGLITLAISRVADITFVGGFAMVPTVWGIVCFGGGWRTARVLTAPVLLLGFMVPLPLVAIAHLNYELKFIAARVAVGLVELLPGGAVRLEGATVLWPGDNGGGAVVMTVDAGCSGLRGLVALTWITAVLAARPGMRSGVRLAMLAASVPLVIVANALRVATLIVIARHAGAETVGPETALHQLIGVVFFMFAAFAMCVIDRLADRLRPRPATPATPISDPNQHHGPVPLANPLGLAALVIACIGLAALGTPVRSSPAPLPDFDRIPRTVVIDGATFRGIDLPSNARLERHLHEARVLHRRYLDPATGRGFDLHIVAHGEDYRALHPPEVCLRAGAVDLPHRCRKWLRVGGEVAPVVCLVSRTDRAAATIRYAYHGPDGYTTGMLGHQAAMLLGRLRGMPRAGALVRILVPGHAADPAGADRLADRAVGVLFGEVDAALTEAAATAASEPVALALIPPALQSDQPRP